jgi:hypothetical protein
MVLVDVVDVSSWIASTLLPLRKVRMPRFRSASGAVMVAPRSAYAVPRETIAGLRRFRNCVGHSSPR